MLSPPPELHAGGLWAQKVALREQLLLTAPQAGTGAEGRAQALFLYEKVEVLFQIALNSCFGKIPK